MLSSARDREVNVISSVKRIIYIQMVVTVHSYFALSVWKLYVVCVTDWQ